MVDGFTINNYNNMNNEPISAENINNIYAIWVTSG